MDDKGISQQPYLTFFSEETAEYDVIVDQSSSAPNLKEATWGAIQPLLPIVGPTMGPEEMALVLEYSPMPESFLEKYKAIQDQKAQQPPPPDPEMLKVQAMQQAKAAELQMKQQEAQTDAQIEQQKTAQQLQLEQQKAAAQIQLEREKAMAQVQLEREKAQVQLMMDRERMAFDSERMKGEMALKASSAKSDMAIKASMARFDMQGKASKQSAENESEGEGAEMPEAEDMDLFGNKALADSMNQMAQALAQMAQANAESQRMMAEGIAALGSELSQAMTKPKQIVRGPDGRAIGVQ
jgi:hypothetical protein